MPTMEDAQAGASYYSTKQLLASRSNQMIILNCAISRTSLFDQLHASSSKVCCADGGANRLYSYDPSLIPNTIIGDLDSIASSTRQYYASKGVDVIQDPSQDSTDLIKALTHLLSTSIPSASTSSSTSTSMSSLSSSSNPSAAAALETAIQNVIVVGGLSGRLDHTVHTLSTMLKFKQSHPNVRLWVAGNESLAFVVAAGRNRLQTCHHLFGPTCGILPLLGTTKVSTVGLEWNMSEGSWAYPTSIMTAVSTSNHLLPPIKKEQTGQEEEEVEVGFECDQDVVWTVEVRGSIY